MDERMTIDPRGRALAPSQEDVDAWAAREHGRRQAWIAGPTEAEKLEWARRSAARAEFGLGELGPSQDEIDAWAERERRRRAAWLAGPTDAEKRQWARTAAARDGSDLPASPDEIEEWATREPARRRAWLEGPTELEKHEWLRRQLERRFSSGRIPLPPEFASEEARLESLRSEVGLAGKDTFEALSRVSDALFSYFVRGRTFVPPRRRRVPY